MCRILKIRCAFNAQELSGSFDDHGVIIEGKLTDLGLGEGRFFTKIVEISANLHPPQIGKFSTLVKECPSQLRYTNTTSIIEVRLIRQSQAELLVTTGSS